MRRVVFYCRVSTDNQEKSETIDNQKRDLYKVYNKADVIKIYEDNPGSGADPDRRGLAELRRDAQKKMFDVIALWSSDRLARDLKLSLILRDEFKELGIAVEIMGKEREDSDMGKLMGVLEGAMDEMERARIKRRFISGRERRLSEGKLIGCYPPYGYNHIRRNKEKGTDASFEINEQEANIVRKIFKWYIELESIFLVTRRLRDKNIRTRGRNGVPRFFSCSMISKVLRREDYIGNHYFGKSSPCPAKFHINKNRKYNITGRRKNPKSEWRMVKVLPIIDVDIFNKAQDIIKKRAKFALKEAKYQFLCQGIIKCVDCNRNYGGRKQDKYLIYRCPQHYATNLNSPVCRSRSMLAGKLDNAVWAYVSSLINDKNILKNNIRLIREKRESEKISNKKVLESLLCEKESLKNKKGKLFELYSEGKFAVGDLEVKINEFTEREKSIDTQIINVGKELKDIKELDSVEKEVEKICMAYQSKVSKPPFELKKYIVRKWVEEIRIEKDGSLIIKIRIPQSEKIDWNNKDVLYNFYPKSNLLELYQPIFKFEEVITP